jgi:microcystin-dependent protein
MPTPYLGEIRWYAGKTIPAGWLPCDGRLLPIDGNELLHLLLEFKYGGSGNQFAIPDLRGRVPVGTGQGIALAQVGGQESVALVLDELPAHTHALAGNKGDGDRSQPADAVWARSEALAFSKEAADATMAGGALASAGTGAPHENMMPFLALTPIIATAGLLPGDDAVDADIYVGEVRMMAFPQVPTNWIPCDDTTYAKGTYDLLDILLGTTFGGSTNQLAVPDLRGRVALHLGGARALGNVGGEAAHALSTGELAAHTHGALAAPVAGDDPSPKGRTWGVQSSGLGYAAAPDVALHPDVLMPAGGAKAHENRPPFLALSHLLSSSGVVPASEDQDPLPDPFLGEVRMFALPFVPDGWAECNGQEIGGDQGQLLGLLFGDTYGHGASGGVVLPDLSGRVVLGAGDQPGSGLSARPLGGKGGAEVVTLQAEHLPAHTHQVRAREHTGGQGSPEGGLFGASQARALSAGYSSAPPAVPMSPAAVGAAGEGQAHNNMAPYLTLRFCISLFGAGP